MSILHGRILLGSIAAVLAAASPALIDALAGQVPANGARLRVTLKGIPTTLTGRLEQLAADTLYLRVTDWQGDTLSRIPLSLVQTAEMSQGRHSKAATGALLGGVIGAVAGYAAGDKSPGAIFRKDAVAAFGWLTGTGVGALVGWQFHSEKWTDVPVASLRVAPVGPVSIGLRIDLRF
jgi:hypothetical protein